jgi:hypothetical protein
MFCTIEAPFALDVDVLALVAFCFRRVQAFGGKLFDHEAGILFYFFLQGNKSPMSKGLPSPARSFFSEKAIHSSIAAPVQVVVCITVEQLIISFISQNSCATFPTTSILTAGASLRRIAQLLGTPTRNSRECSSDPKIGLGLAQKQKNVLSMPVTITACDSNRRHELVTNFPPPPNQRRARHGRTDLLLCFIADEAGPLQ